MANGGIPAISFTTPSIQRRVPFLETLGQEAAIAGVRGVLGLLLSKADAAAARRNKFREDLDTGEITEVTPEIDEDILTSGGDPDLLRFPGPGGKQYIRRQDKLTTEQRLRALQPLPLPSPIADRIPDPIEKELTRGLAEQFPGIFEATMAEVATARPEDMARVNARLSALAALGGSAGAAVESLQGRVQPGITERELKGLADEAASLSQLIRTEMDIRADNYRGDRQLHLQEVEFANVIQTTRVLKDDKDRIRPLDFNEATMFVRDPRGTTAKFKAQGLTLSFAGETLDLEGHIDRLQKQESNQLLLGYWERLVALDMGKELLSQGLNPDAPLPFMFGPTARPYLKALHLTSKYLTPNDFLLAVEQGNEPQASLDSNTLRIMEVLYNNGVSPLAPKGMNLAPGTLQNARGSVEAIQAERGRLEEAAATGILFQPAQDPGKQLQGARGLGGDPLGAGAKISELGFKAGKTVVGAAKEAIVGRKGTEGAVPRPVSALPQRFSTEDRVFFDDVVDRVSKSPGDTTRLRLQYFQFIQDPESYRQHLRDVDAPQIQDTTQRNEFLRDIEGATPAELQELARGDSLLVEAAITSFFNRTPKAPAGGQ